MKTNCWISLIFICFLSGLLAQKPIESSGLFAIDLDSKANISTFKNLTFNTFKENETVDIGYNNNDAIWCVVKCKNTTDKTVNRLMVLDNIFLDSISYWINGDYGVMGDRTGQQDEYMSAYTFPFELAPRDSVEIRMRIKKTISLFHFSYKIEAREKVARESRNHLATISVFLGILIFSVFFYCFIIFKNRKRIYFILIFYVLISCLYIVITSGFARYMISPDMFYIGEFRIFSGSFWYVVTGLLFIEFLEMKTYHRVYHKIITSFILSLTLLIISAILLIILELYVPLKAITFIAYIHYLVLMPLILLCVIKHFKINFQNSIYALIAFSSHFIWQTTGLLTTFKILPDNTKLDWFIYVGVFQGILFIYVLTREYIHAFYKSIRLGQEIIDEKQRTILSISQTQVAERRKVASILHDNFGVKMAQLLHLAELDKKEELVKQIHDLSSDIRVASHNILPKSLDDGFLLASIQNHIEILKTSKPVLDLELTSFDFPDKIDSEWRFDLYLISLEIIHNALKHGEAAEVDLEFFAYEESFVFQFTDNGKGFDANSVSGFGLNSMKRRVEQYGGSFEINSESGEGTVIQIELPKVSS